MILNIFFPEEAFRAHLLSLLNQQNYLSWHLPQACLPISEFYQNPKISHFSSKPLKMTLLLPISFATVKLLSVLKEQ